MAGRERFGGSNEVKAANDQLKDSLATNLPKMPEEERKVVEAIMTDMDVMHESYTNNVEAIDFGIPENANGMYSLARGALKKMRSLGTNREKADLYGIYLGQLREAIGKKDRLAILDAAKGLDQAALMFTSTVALEKADRTEKPVEKAPEKKEEPVEQVEVVLEDPDVARRNYMQQLEAKLEQDYEINVGTDHLNRAESMRFVYCSSNLEDPLATFEGDQILLQIALKELVESTSYGLKSPKPLLDTINKFTTRDVAYIIAAYQQIKELKVDGKFGPNTFERLKKDYKEGTIIDRVTGTEAVSKYKQFKNIRNYIDRPKSTPKKAVENDDAWYEKEADLSAEMNEGLNNLDNLTSEQKQELRGVILERFVHYNGDAEAFAEVLEGNEDKIKSLLKEGEQDFQVEAIMDAIKVDPKAAVEAAKSGVQEGVEAATNGSVFETAKNYVKNAFSTSAPEEKDMGSPSEGGMSEMPQDDMGGDAEGGMSKMPEEDLGGNQLVGGFEVEEGDE